MNVDNKNRLTFLDGLRGLAFLIVFFSHVSIAKGFFAAGSGKIGVWIFFILSSFLLTRYFVVETSRVYSLREWLNYFIRRILRIYPLFALIVTIDYLMKIDIQTKADWIDNLILLKGNGHFWTIPVETHYYLILPIVAIIILVVGKGRIVFSAILFFAFLIIHQFLYPYTTSTINSPQLLPYLPVFIMGSVLSLIYQTIKTENISIRLQKIFGVSSIILLIGLLITFPRIWSLIAYKVPDDYFHRGFLYYGLVVSILIISISYGKGLVRRMFESSILRFFGKISFPAYLIHPLVINRFETYFPNGSTFIFVISSLLIVMGISYLIHISIERPLSMISVLQRNKNTTIQTPV